MHKSGSITIFLSLALVIITSLFLTLLESARLYGLIAQSDMEGDLLLEFKMAAYQKEVFDRYHLYCLEANQGGTLDLAGVEQELLTEGEANLAGEALSFYRMALTEAVAVNYCLMTDDSGVAFRQQAADYMKRNLLSTGIEKLYEHAMQAEEITADVGNVDQKIDTAETELKKEKAAQSAGTAESTGTAEPTGATLAGESPSTGEVEVSQAEIDKAAKMDNPLEHVKELKNKGILSMVVEDVSEVSQLIITEDNLTGRVCNQGNYEKQKEIGAGDAIFFKEYLIQEFGCYTGTKENTALAYELEYLIANKDSDADNLTAVVERLLGIREAVNYVYLRSDKEKYALSHTMALAIAGVSVNPLIIAAVREGILAAWAFTESVGDVKTLLAGGKVPLLKSQTDWNLNVENLSETVEQGDETQQKENGLSYTDYLRIMLYMSGGDKLAMRALNIMEQNIRLELDDTDFYMDCMIAVMRIEAVYEANSLFFEILQSKTGWNRAYSFPISKEFGY